MTHTSNTFARVGLAALAAASITLLAACGGGGGDVTTTPPPVVLKKGILSVASCVVEAGKNSCSLSATASGLENVTTTTFQTSSGSVPGPGPSTLQVPLGEFDVILTGDNVELDKKKVTVGCAPGLVPQGATCVQLKAEGTLSVLQATIADDGNTASVVVDFTSKYTSALTVTVGTETKNVPAGSGQVTFVRTGVSDLPVSLKDNGIEIASGVSKASCSPVAKWDASTPVCREVLAHTDAVVAVWDLNGRFYFVGEAGFTEVKNLTPWNDMGANRFYYFGGIKQGVTDEFCRIRVVAVDSVSRVWRQMYIDAKRKELHVLPGTEAVIDFDPRGSYDFVHEYDPALLNASAYAKVSTGEFYTRADDEFKLLFKPTGQDTRLVYPWVGSEGGNLKVMRSSTCK